MEASTSGLVTNFINTTIVNFNIQVLVNLFLYSAAVTFGVSISSKIITLLFEELLKFLRFQLELKYKDKMEEIRELNRKMHDRLVELEESIKSNKYPKERTRIRLLYNTSRIAKYDETITNDVYLLLNNWTVMLSLKERGNINSGELSKCRTDSMDLIKTINSKIDKLLV